jgi:deazaflavin-dependent oxidoreductase (nitroreductase family)
MQTGTSEDHPVRTDQRRRVTVRGNLASRAERFTAPMHVTIFGAGLSPRRWVVLEVAGRRSGQTRRFPVAMTDYDGGRYVVSRLGERSNWVRNVRAANGIVTIRHGHRQRCRLIEMAVHDRAPILKSYLNQVPFGRLHVPIDHAAPVSAFETVANRYPVFRVEPDDGGPRVIRDGPMTSSGADQLPGDRN